MAWKLVKITDICEVWWLFLFNSGDAHWLFLCSL